MGSKEITNTYDDLGQLTKEVAGDTTLTYTYDDAGNIKSKKVCNLTTGAVARNDDYYYSSSAWGDRLTAFGGTGQITYDAIGNPLTYNNGTTYHFTWEGRNLTRVYTSGYATHFTYNSDGIRTARYSDNGSRTEFILNGSQILAEVSENSVIAYIYDANGSPIGMQHRLTTYAEDVWDIFWFDKNLQGDIVAVYNEYGVKCISYAYDAWGNSRVTTHDETGTNKYAIKNSFRYRGYYYDRTISMYYLNSRYYDPITCRFINADGYVSTGQGLIGNNMFAYCCNNPVNCVDYSGEFAIPFPIPAEYIFLLGLLAVGMFGLIADATGEQKLGNIFSDIVTQTADAVDDFISSIKTFSDSKADEKEEVNPNPPSGTIVYRYYSSKTENLAPRAGRDYDGLSFSTIPPVNGKPYTVTTIEQINSTGILIAERQGTHVTVRPTNGTVLEWMYQGMDSIWSRTLSEIVVEWE